MLSTCQFDIHLHLQHRYVLFQFQMALDNTIIMHKMVLVATLILALCHLELAGEFVGFQLRSKRKSGRRPLLNAVVVLLILSISAG